MIFKVFFSSSVFFFLNKLQMKNYIAKSAKMVSNGCCIGSLALEMICFISLVIALFAFKIIVSSSCFFSSIKLTDWKWKTRENEREREEKPRGDDLCNLMWNQNYRNVELVAVWKLCEDKSHASWTSWSSRWGIQSPSEAQAEIKASPTKNNNNNEAHKWILTQTQTRVPTANTQSHQLQPNPKRTNWNKPCK